jgi:hypothetical protein
MTNYLIIFLDAINAEGVDLSIICPPACTESTYEASISAVPFKEVTSGESVVRVFFKHSSVVKYKRDQLYAFEDIICKYMSKVAQTLECWNAAAIA